MVVLFFVAAIVGRALRRSKGSLPFEVRREHSTTWIFLHLSVSCLPYLSVHTSYSYHFLPWNQSLFLQRLLDYSLFKWCLMMIHCPLTVIQSLFCHGFWGLICKTFQLKKGCPCHLLFIYFLPTAFSIGASSSFIFLFSQKLVAL